MLYVVTNIGNTDASVAGSIHIRDGRVGGVTPPRSAAGRGGDGVLRGFTVSPPLDNLEFFKYSQIVRDIFYSF